MAYELVYTSAHRGLKPGTRGFCTVAHTRDMPAAAIRLAESLSGYRHLYQPHDARHARNPVAYSHYTATLAGSDVSVLSRVAAYGTDYSGRTNKLAHHLIFAADERPACGPALLMAQADYFVDQWDGDPRQLDPRDPPAAPPAAGYRAEAWEALGADPGWAGVLAQAFLDSPQRDAHIVYSPGTDVLALFRDALALLPPDARWRVTFSTYFTSSPSGSTCRWRGCVAGSDVQRKARQRRDALIIDLSKKPVAAAEGASPLIACARDGSVPPWKRKPPAPKRSARPEPTPAPARRVAVVAPVTEPEDAEEGSIEPGDITLKHRAAKKHVIKRSSVSHGTRSHATAPASGFPMWLPVAALVGIAAVAGLVFLAIRVLNPPPPEPQPRPPPVARKPHKPDKPPVVPDEGTRPDEKPTTGDIASTGTGQTEPPVEPRRPEVEPPPDIGTRPPVEEWPAPAHPILLARLDTFSRSTSAGTIAIPEAPGWGDYQFGFYGARGRRQTAAPVQDIDRLADKLRSLTYTLDSLGLSAVVTSGGIKWSRLTDASALGNDALHCIRVRRDVGTPDVLIWTRAMRLRATDHQTTFTGPEVHLPLTQTLGLLTDLLVPDKMRCRVGFSGTEFTHERPFIVIKRSDEFVVAVDLPDDELATIARVLARGAEPTPATPQHKAAALLDYSNLGDRHNRLVQEGGTEAKLTSSVRRARVTRDLRSLLVDYCERPLAKEGGRHPDAARVGQALSAVYRRIDAALDGDLDTFEEVEVDEDEAAFDAGNDDFVVVAEGRKARKLVDRGRRGKRAIGDFVDEPEPFRVKRRPRTFEDDPPISQGQRIAFFKKELLPSNKYLTPEVLAAIVNSTELQALVSDPGGAPAVAAAEPPPPVNLPRVNALHFYPRRGVLDPILVVTCGEASSS